VSGQGRPGDSVVDAAGLRLGIVCTRWNGQVVGTMLERALWLDPLGPLVKILPSLLLTLAALAILDER